MNECTSNVKQRMKFLVRSYTAMLRALPDDGAGEADGAGVKHRQRVLERLARDTPPRQDDELVKCAIELARDAFKEPREYYFHPRDIERIPVQCLHMDMVVLEQLEELAAAGNADEINSYLRQRVTAAALPFMWISEMKDLEASPPLARLHAVFQRLGRVNACEAGALLSVAVAQAQQQDAAGGSSSSVVSVFGQSTSRDDLDAFTLAWLVTISNVFTYVEIRPITRWVAMLRAGAAAALERHFSHCPAAVLADIVDFYQNDLTVKLVTGDIDDEHLNTSANVLTVLNRANYAAVQDGIIPHTKFYNNTALDFDVRDMKQDFIRLIESRQQPSVFSFCRYPFLIDANFKSFMMQLEAVLETEGAMRNTFMSALFNPAAGAAEQQHFLILNIARDNLLTSALREVGRNQHRLNRPLRVKFQGEDGIDEGGVRKEFFQLLCKMLLDPDYGMFTTSETRCMWFVADARNSSNRPEFRLIGQVLGLAVYNNVMLDVSFPRCLYRLILRPAATLTLDDLEEVDSGLAQGLRELLIFEEAPDEGLTVEDVFCRCFVYEHDVFGEKVEIPLVPNGESMSLTSANRQEFVDAVVEYVLRAGIRENFDAFRGGFLSVCNRPLFQSMRPEELELLVCGSSALNFEELRDSTRYDGYSAEDQVIVDFWDVVCTQLTADEQKQFLRFCTGSDKVPIRGLRDLRFVIGKNGDDSDMLPTAHTCFNHLLLPEYTSKEKLKEKLLLAIKNCQGFGLK